jgi:hypothetical protein
MSDTVTALTGLKGWLQAHTEMRRHMRQRTPRRQLPKALGNYCGLEDFVLRHGRRWQLRDLPKGVEAGRIRECFKNASDLALNDDAYVYCEGYATGYILPVQHAWCLDRNGAVVDTTWVERSPDSGEPEYIGVAVRTDYLREQVLKAATYEGVIDLPNWRYPILTTPLRRWRHPITRKGLPLVLS